MVVRDVPLNCTVAPETKPVPFTLKVKPGLPATADEGLIEVRVGALMLKVNVFDGEPQKPVVVDLAAVQT